MKKAEISIVIPTYNQANFLKLALNSLLAQTFKQWEAIVVNNFSDDNTVEVVRTLKDNRIKLVNFANNGVIASSRNVGIELANSPIIAFLDSDDIWYPKKLERCFNHLNSGFDIVCHGEFWVQKNQTRRSVKYGPAVAASYFNLLFNQNCLSTSAVMAFRKPIMAVGKFSDDPSYNTAEDYDLWLKMAKYGCKFGFLEDMLGEYRIHDKNHSGAVEKNTNAVLCVVEDHFNALDKELRNFSKERRRRAIVYYGCAREYQLKRDFEKAGHFLLKSLGIYPYFVKCWIALLLNIVRVKV